MTNKQINIGIFGFGNVGQGLYEVLQKSPSTKASIKKVVVKQRNKARNLAPNLVSFDPNDILHSTEINTVAELIDNADDALRIVTQALRAGKNVVSGNKKMIAENLENLLELQAETGSSLLYDASACGSIPVIRNLEEYYDNDLLKGITGILNGSSNYILTQMHRHNTTYEKALKEAQEKGFAESDPTFDVDGFDAMYKLIILGLHGFGIIVKPDDIFFTGISNIKATDIQLAREKGKKIKLVARAFKVSENKIALLVTPAFIGPESYVYNVDEEFNGVVIEGEAYEEQLMFGKGAGSHPTGSAVLSDITAMSYNYKYEYKKRKFTNQPQHTNDVIVKAYFRYTQANVPDLLPLQSIEEQYTGPDFQYTVGFVKLSDLLKTKDILRKFEVFMALQQYKSK